MKDPEANDSPTQKMAVLSLEPVVSKVKIHDPPATLCVAMRAGQASRNARNRRINDPRRSDKVKKLKTLSEVS